MTDLEKRRAPAAVKAAMAAAEAHRDIALICKYQGDLNINHVDYEAVISATNLACSVRLDSATKAREILASIGRDLDE